MVNPAQFSIFWVILTSISVIHSTTCFHMSMKLDSFSLVQVVPSFTHVSLNRTMSLIDLALLSDISCLQSCTTLPPLSSSDHLGVSLAIKWKVSKKTSCPKLRCIWNYRSTDFSKACHLIQSTNWDSLLSDDVNLAYQLIAGQRSSLKSWKSVYLSATWKMQKSSLADHKYYVAHAKAKQYVFES